MLGKFFPRQYDRFLFRILIVLSFIGAVFLSSALPVISQSADTVEIAAALSLTGDSYTFGQGSLEGIQLAIEEANASRIKP
nr:MAG: hypothetical protein EDM05_11015 [Leptolyngbya sp. IPPAS B-1204]